MKRQREEYETAMVTINKLTEQMDTARVVSSCVQSLAVLFNVGKEIMLHAPLALLLLLPHAPLVMIL